MYDFVKMMYKAGCDISGYVTMGAISQADYDDILKGG